MFAKYIVFNNATIRETARYYGYSKSTVHNDISKKLRKINSVLYEEVRVILQNNFFEKHIRGGLATKNKYEKNKSL